MTETQNTSRRPGALIAMSGWWSRRIDETNRIVYYEQGDVIYIISCLGHYDD